jgi:hypothetical protein
MPGIRPERVEIPSTGSNGSPERLEMPAEGQFYISKNDNKPATTNITTFFRSLLVHRRNHKSPAGRVDMLPWRDA